MLPKQLQSLIAPLVRTFVHLYFRLMRKRVDAVTELILKHKGIVCILSGMLVCTCVRCVCTCVCCVRMSVHLYF